MKNLFGILLLVPFMAYAQTEVPQSTVQTSDVVSNETPAAVPVRAVELDPITVTSELGKQNGPLVTAPGSQIKKDRLQIQTAAPHTLQDVLSTETNIEFTGGPRGTGEKPQIRGLNADRILILDEGVRQNFQNVHNGRVFTDFSLMEDVEVIKGPWSSLYGSGAMGGVIRLSKSTAADLVSRRGKTFGGEFALDSSSAGVGFGQRITGFAKKGLFEPLLSYRHYQNSDLRLGTNEALQYSGTEANDLYASLGFDFGTGHHLDVKLNEHEEKGKVPQNPADDPSPTLNPVVDQTTNKQDVVGIYRLNGSWGDLRANPYVRRTFVQNVNGTRTDRQMVTTTGLDTWVNVPAEVNENLKFTNTVGFETFQDKNKGERNGGPLSSFPSGESNQYGAYFQPSIVAGKIVTITPGVRYDNYNRRDDSGVSADNSGDRTSSKLYASVEYLPNQRVFAGWGQAFNAPRLQDLYASGMHFPGNFFVANPDLKPETSDTAEAGFKNKWTVDGDNAAFFEGTIFQTNSKDFIQRAVAATTTQFQNVDRVRLTGGEVTARWQNLSWGTVLSYNEVRSRDLNSGAPLADTSPDRWSAKAETYIGDHYTVGTNLVLAEKQDLVPTGTDETPGYFTQDFYVTFANKWLEAQVRVNNAFDRKYRKHGEPLYEVGRDVRVGASWLF